MMNDDVAVDSYALTAVGGGYWVCVADRRQWPGLHSPEEPTSVLVVKVVDRYFAGEVKVIESSNPLSELLTMQQVVDLAGQVQDYAFDWKIAAAIDGQEPAVNENTRRLLLPDNSAWKHVRLPASTDMPRSIHLTAEARVTADVRQSVEAVSEGEVVQPGSPQSIIFREFDTPPNARIPALAEPESRSVPGGESLCQRHPGGDGQPGRGRHSATLGSTRVRAVVPSLSD